jgi:hypothetical protein
MSFGYNRGAGANLSRRDFDRDLQSDPFQGLHAWSTVEQRALVHYVHFMLLHCLCRFKLLRLFSDSLPIGTYDQFGCGQSIGVAGPSSAIAFVRPGGFAPR